MPCARPSHQREPGCTARPGVVIVQKLAGAAGHAVDGLGFSSSRPGLVPAANTMQSRDGRANSMGASLLHPIPLFCVSYVVGGLLLNLVDIIACHTVLWWNRPNGVILGVGA